jgi:hypothetical protein
VGIKKEANRKYKKEEIKGKSRIERRENEYFKHLFLF